MKPYEQTAVAFANALVKGEFTKAHQLLTPSLRNELSPDALRDELNAMIDYGDGPPKDIYFSSEHSLDEWPAKEAGDVGWAYVGVTGDDFNEAVRVVVADVDGVLLIRSIEWGRP